MPPKKLYTNAIEDCFLSPAICQSCHMIFGGCPTNPPLLVLVIQSALVMKCPHPVCTRGGTTTPHLCQTHIIYSQSLSICKQARFGVYIFLHPKENLFSTTVVLQSILWHLRSSSALSLSMLHSHHSTHLNLECGLISKGAHKPTACVLLEGFYRTFLAFQVPKFMESVCVSQCVLIGS